MPKIDVNGIVRDMTQEEIERMNSFENIVVEETPEDRLAKLEALFQKLMPLLEQLGVEDV